MGYQNEKDWDDFCALDVPGEGDPEKGVKHDTGKPRWGLLPFGPLSEVVDVMTFGAEKYSPGNWMEVPNARERYIDAAFRHLVAWVSGERLDDDSGKSHLAHVVCCVLFLMWFDDPKAGK